MLNKDLNFLILGAFSENKAGDDAILYSTVREVWKYNSSTTYIPSNTPNHIRNIFNYDERIKPISTQGLSINYLNFKTFKLLRKIDFILYTQSNFLDYKGFPPGSSFLPALAALISIAKIVNPSVKIIGHNVGIGPLFHKLGCYFRDVVLKNSDYVYFRQKSFNSLKGTEEILNGKSKIHADSALSVYPLESKRVKEIINEDKRYIGINMKINWGTGRRSLPFQIEAIINSINYVSKLFGLIPIVINTGGKEDDGICKKVLNALNAPEKKYVSSIDYNFREITYVLGKMELFFGIRLHSVILAVAQYVPAIAVKYLPKCTDFIDRVGLDEYSFNIDEINERDLIKVMQIMFEERNNIKSNLMKRVDELRRLSLLTTEEMFKI